MKADEKLLSGRGVASYSVGPKAGSQGGTETARKPKRPAKKTVIHDAIWRAHGIPIPEAEFPFHTTRRWKFDYAWADYGHGGVTRWIAMEIQGGLFTRGRHTRGAALVKEYEKINEAQLAGWIVLLITPDQIKDGSAFELIRRALA